VEVRVDLARRVALLGALALLAGAAWALIPLLAGCSAPTRVESLSIVSVPDSVRWIQVGRPNPYALVWRDGTVNLWLQGRETLECGVFNREAHTFRWSVVYRGSGVDTIRGVVTASWSDSAMVTGGTFWLVNEADTLRGQAETTLTSPCGSRSYTSTLTLVRAAP